jgi:hypothetical protein
VKKGGNEVVTVIETPTFMCAAVGTARFLGVPSGRTVLVTFDAYRVTDVGALLSGEQKLDEGGALMPAGSVDMTRPSMPNGTRMQVGELPAWSAGRLHVLQPDVGKQSFSRGSIVACVPLALSGSGLSYVHSMLVFRCTPQMPLVAAQQDDPNFVIPEGWHAGTPTGTDEPVTTLSKLTAIEFSQAAIGIFAPVKIGTAIGAAEWVEPDGSAIGGIACLSVLDPSYVGEAPSTGIKSEQIKYFGYSVTLDTSDPDAVAVGTVPWSATLTIGDIAGEPASIPAYASGYDPTFTYYGNGYSSSPRPAFPIEYSSSPYLVTSGALSTLQQSDSGLLGIPRSVFPDATATATGIVRIKVPTAGGAVTLPGSKPGPGFPPTAVWTALSTVEFTYYRNVTVLVRAGAGGVSGQVLYEYHEDLYNHHGDLNELVWAPYNAVYDAAGNQSLVSARVTRRWQIDPPRHVFDNPSNPLLPTTKSAIRPTRYFQNADEVDFVLVRDNGAIVGLSFGLYMPWVFNATKANSTDPGDSGRLEHIAIGDQFWNRAAPKKSEPFCQYSDGTIAVLLTPKADFMAALRRIYIGIVDVASSTLIQIGPQLASINSNSATIVTLSCHERAVENEGAPGIAAHGKLLLSVNGGGGLFCISNIGTIAWLDDGAFWDVEHYIGNPLAPADIGEKMKLDW